MNDPRMSRRLFHGLNGGGALTAAGVTAGPAAANVSGGLRHLRSD
ncbi:hypothetical protein [Streptomyces decoyicus]